MWFWYFYAFPGIMSHLVIAV